MKAVLISIKPKWCELIASGKKTIEVRKTKPKIDVPFKCYIYETKALYKPSGDKCLYEGKGKVIGEFVCDEIIPLAVKYSNPESHIALKEFPYTCMTDKQIIDYLGNGVEGYGWHISQLKIYDKPKELSEFFAIKCNHKAKSCGECSIKSCIKNLSRPPQSWCYVNEVK